MSRTFGACVWGELCHGGSLEGALPTVIVDVMVRGWDGTPIATSETLDDLVSAGATPQEAVEAFAADMLD